MATRGGYRIGAGRKKGFSSLESEKARQIVCEKLTKNFGPIVDMAIKQAKNGDKYAREWVTERAYGKVASSEKEFMFNQQINFGALESLSNEELARMIESGTK